MSSEEEDPVIYEIPVHFSSELSDGLYVAQFPLRPSYREIATPASAEFRPENKMLKLEMPVHQDPEHFDDEAEEYLKRKTFPLESQRIPSITNYAVGVYRDNQLHITPVQSVVQMRPNFEHIDHAANEEEDIDFIEDEVVEKKTKPKEESKQVELKFQKKESARTIAARQNSYHYLRQTQEAEKWIQMNVYDAKEEASKDEFELLFSESEDPVEFRMEKATYLHHLQHRSSSTFPLTRSAPPLSSGSTQSGPSSSPPPSTSSSDDYQASLDPLQQRFYKALKTDHRLTFAQLCSLEPSLSPEQVLESIDNLVIVINGYFLLRQVSYVRQAVLWFLHQNLKSGVTRVALAHALTESADVIKSILLEYAEFDASCRIWRFPAKVDDQVRKLDPEFMERQDKLWRDRTVEFESQFPMPLKKIERMSV